MKYHTKDDISVSDLAALDFFSEVQGLMAEDPFVTLDDERVGELIQVAMRRGQSTRPEMPTGIREECGSDPKSIDFCPRRETKQTGLLMDR